ncbi:hypothetical protein SSX86_031269, partial [Deinandra increscens subsp. villosa]
MLKLRHDDYGPTPFRLFSSWFERKDFDSIVIKGLADAPFDPRPDVNLLGKLKHVKALLKIWNRSWLKEENLDYDQLLSLCNRYEVMAEVNLITPAEKEDWADAKSKLLCIDARRGADLRQKARVNLDWDFLDSILAQMNFPCKWRAWIRGILKASRTSILVNGSPTFEFQCSRGVRQGDPLSPYLFLIAMEALSWMFKKALACGAFNGIALPNNGPIISHVLFADDALVIGQWSERNVMNLCRLLRAFGLASGLRINLLKCNLYGIGVPNSEVDAFASVLKCKGGSFPFKYLGLLVGPNMNRISHWKPVIETFEARLSRWKARYLSLGGRLVLAKAVLEALPSYFFSLYLAPVSVINQLESLRMRFLWSGGNKKGCIHWVSKDAVCRTKADGGMGLVPLDKANYCFLSKWYNISNKLIFFNFSTDYLDHGDQIVICDVCNAKLWKDEAVLGRTTELGKCYSLCCAYGKVQLPHLKEPSPTYKELFSSRNNKSKYFLKNIRRYNSMFAFTSMGGKVDKSINKGKGPFTFRLSGENYHTIGTLLPKEGVKPKFSQLYIYDTENEVGNRQRAFRSDKPEGAFDVQLIKELKVMLDKENPLVKSYRMVRDSLSKNPDSNLNLRLISSRKNDGRTYNLPTASEVAVLIVGDVCDLIDHRDIIVTTKSGSLQRISELHPSYLPLQYPLLFPNGDDGYRINIPHRNITDTSTRGKCTMREFFSFRIQDRVNEFSLILNSRRLYQQFLVDAYTMIESERLGFIRGKQSLLRAETLQNLNNAKNDGNTDLSSTGQRVILPSSFTGGARFMMQNFLDAMSLCKWYGYPDLFITITCNPRWPEVVRILEDTTLNPDDRPCLLCRMFKMKLESLMKDLKEKATFGKVQAVVYTVEFQKRGLPHAHICLFLHPDDKLPTPEHIDRVISAEIPDKNEDPELYSLVREFMIHGPCGHHNMKSPCMSNKNCTKNFPKKFRDRTSTDQDGFPLYRRRRDGPTIMKSGSEIDTRYVVPYNKFLLKKYQSHINVEWCNQGNAIKYLFKYINKGPDRTQLKFDNTEKGSEQLKVRDEIKDYYNCRYISACEATWRIFSNKVHYRYPTVLRLPFHLPGQQQVVFGEEDDIDDVIEKASVCSSMFLDWMRSNDMYPEARSLTYVQFPSKFVWKAKDRCWKPRKRGICVGRIHSVSPALGEAYFLRILLNKVKGPKSFEAIRTVNGHLHDTFKDACYALGLLDDDREYIEAIVEASHHGSGHYLRNLFATLLWSNTLSRPEHVWENSWKTLSDGIVYQRKHNPNTQCSSIDPDQLKNLTLLEIQKILLCNNSSLSNFQSMPFPNDVSILLCDNMLIDEELSYEKDGMKKEFEDLFVKLTDEQRLIFEEIDSAVNSKKGGVFFVYGYGGTGKTFLWNTLSASVRSKGDIVLNVASSGIASLLLPGGRTAHSRFRIPINITEDSICGLKQKSDAAELLKRTSLIIWDEAPMTNKHCFEALDRTLNDILLTHKASNKKCFFGGKVVVFGGDFRQILPVVQGGNDEDIVNASLSSSYIWHECKVLKLTKNMRLTQGNQLSNVESIKTFAEWLLQLGEGLLGGENDGHANIKIPHDLLIHDSVNPLQDLIQFVYPSILENFKDPAYWKERAILAPTNEIVYEINERLLNVIPGDEKEYLSSDTLCPTEDIQETVDQGVYSPDFLNGLHFGGLPNHRLVLKKGVPVMLLRNLDQKNGLCNGTRLQILSLGKRVIEAEVISGNNLGFRTFLPRISMSPSDKKIPFKFQRRQFPIALCFGMTVNKSQGQSLSRVGLYLKTPCFSHGQLYVALSRVKSRQGLKLLILDDDGKVTDETLNVVYKSVFSN